jgi:hypothetical protein
MVDAFVAALRLDEADGIESPTSDAVAPHP